MNYAILGYSFGGGGGHDIKIIDKSNINSGSSSNIYSYTPPTYPCGSDQNTFLTGGLRNWLTTEIEVHQLFKWAFVWKKK